MSLSADASTPCPFVRHEQQQTHPKLDYPAILGDVFASKEDMAAVRRMSPADLRKFFRRCQLVRSLPVPLYPCHQVECALTDSALHSPSPLAVADLQRPLHPAARPHDPPAPHRPPAARDADDAAARDHAERAAGPVQDPARAGRVVARLARDVARRRKGRRQEAPRAVGLRRDQGAAQGGRRHAPARPQAHRPALGLQLRRLGGGGQRRARGEPAQAVPRRAVVRPSRAVLRPGQAMANPCALLSPFPAGWRTGPPART